MDSILEKLEYWADKNPQKLLYSFLDINGNQIEKYSYEEFIHRTNVIAGNLNNEFQFKKNDRVLLAYPPGVEMICAFFACVRLGLIPVPVYPPTAHGFQAAFYKISHIAKDCKAAAILTSKDYYWSFKLNLSRNSITNYQLTSNYISKLNWINTEDFRDLNPAGFTKGHSDILFLQYTSGSTSDPKGVMVSHKNILHNCELVGDHLPIGVSWLPQYHDMGLIGYYLFFALVGGTTYGFSPLHFIERPSLWLETISKYQATASSAPNFAYEYVLRPGKISEQTLEKLDLSSLQFLMTAAEPVKTGTYMRFLEFFKPYGLNPEKYFAAYGLAENTLAVTNYGRKILTVEKDDLKQHKVTVAAKDADPALVTEIMSCGTALGDIIVKIVDQDKHISLPDGSVGEVWVGGDSKCQGYWHNPELTKRSFQAVIVNEDNSNGTYMRTGDLGFMYDGELYICGRIKDMIIIRGLNYYPQDIEHIVEESSDHIRHGSVVAFDILDGDEEKLVVVVGVKTPKSLPDPVKITSAIRKNLNIVPHEIVFILARDIPKTSSGKIIRHKTKSDYLDGSMKVVEHYAGPTEQEQNDAAMAAPTGSSPFDAIKVKYKLTGNESHSLIDAGLDSLDLVILIHDIKEILKDKGASALAKEIETSLIQEVSVSEFFALVEQFESSSADAIIRLRNMIIKLQKEHRAYERNLILSDVHLLFNPEKPVYDAAAPSTGIVLLTGGTGFFGPFILKSLMEQTDDKIYVIVRAGSEAEGMERLKTAMESIEPVTPEMVKLLNERVVPVPGDLSETRLGLPKATWDFLAENVHTIYNNGAIVNYLWNYDKMRKANVLGTNEILKLAFDKRPKVFNHISTTFIFGWAVKDVLYETDSNDDLDLLDFGYSQTKYVSEQIVKEAFAKGLNGRIFRPALISPSIEGGGHNFDISIRLLAFMINNGIGVDAHNQVSFTPADISANNIVAICNMPESVNTTFHVTRDTYANMLEITNIITKLTGKEFKIYKLPNFVPVVIDKCKQDDLLFPLLDFLVRSVDNITSMEFKLYDSSNFQNYRNKSEWGKQDPSLEEVVRGILTFMMKKEIISVKMLEPAAAPAAVTV